MPVPNFCPQCMRAAGLSPWRASMRCRSPLTPTLPFLPRLDPYLPVGGRGGTPSFWKNWTGLQILDGWPDSGDHARWPTSRGVPSGRQSAGPPDADDGRLHTEDISWVTGTRRRDVQRRRSVRRTGVRRAHGRGFYTEDISWMTGTRRRDCLGCTFLSSVYGREATAADYRRLGESGAWNPTGGLAAWAR